MDSEDRLTKALAKKSGSVIIVAEEFQGGEDQSYMLGRTHFFIGITTALAIFEPSSLPILVAGTGAAALGGILPDIDAGTSGASRETEKIIGVSKNPMGEFNFDGVRE